MDPEQLRKQIKKWVIIGAFFALGLLFYALEWRLMLKIYVLAVAVLAVLAILIQSGRGEGLAATFGGVGGDSLLGARSATPIAKATYVMLALFIFLSALIARLGPQEALPPIGTQEVPAAAPDDHDSNGTP